MLFVPPFGEEMNKSRRQFAVTAKALVEKGYAALLFDLFGTGDSDGEFAEATWDHWKADFATAVAWIDNSGLLLDAIVASRLGCVLAAESLCSMERKVARSVFWQPVDSGRQYMTQLLRVRAAASMMESSNRETIDQLRQKFEDGETVEVGGYLLSPSLWRSINSVELSKSLSIALGNIALFEVGRFRGGQLSATGSRLLSAAEERGIEGLGQRITGDLFWTATEVVINHELAQYTVDFINRGML